MYETFPAAEAFALAQRFEFYLTPKSASRWNRIEIEFLALAKQCLDRRIPTQEKLAAEIQASVREREQKKLQIHSQFSTELARGKFSRHYARIHAGHASCHTT